MKHYFIIILITSFAIISNLLTASAQVPAGKVDIVAVTGCVVEKESGQWVLTAATDPEPSIANGPPSDEPFEGPMAYLVWRRPSTHEVAFHRVGLSVARALALTAIKPRTLEALVMQLEAEGRPDGRRPEGFSSLLEYCENTRDECENSENDEFSLNESECEDLFQEAWQYYHRYLSLFYL